jgi:nitroreductase
VQEVGLFEAIYSQRSFTRFKSDPVPRAAIEHIIDAATKAPSGGNSQPWEFIAITDPEVIAQVGNIYREMVSEYLAARPDADESPVFRAARYLSDHMHEVPAMILVCVDHARVDLARVDHGNSSMSGQTGAFVRGSLASFIWPAVQNMFLAARALGLGTRLTTAHVGAEGRIKEILGILDHVETVMLTPLGYPRGSFGATQRRPSAEVTSYNRYGNRG